MPEILTGTGRRTAYALTLQANPHAINKQEKSILDLCKTDELHALVENAIQEAEELKVGSGFKWPNNPVKALSMINCCFVFGRFFMPPRQLRKRQRMGGQSERRGATCGEAGRARRLGPLARWTRRSIPGLRMRPPLPLLLLNAWKPRQQRSRVTIHLLWRKNRRWSSALAMKTRAVHAMGLT